MDFLGRELTSGDFGSVAAAIGAGRDLSSGTYGPYSVQDTGHGTRIVTYNGGGGGGGGGGDFISSLLGGIKKIKPYDEVNPFSFDEALAREASTKEYSPYYDEMLSDYVSSVERTKSRSQEDLSRTLAQLQGGKEYYMGKERRALDKAMRSVNEGYAGRGLFFSGVRGRDLSELEKEYGADVGEYNRQYTYNTEQAKLDANRTVEDVNLAKTMYSRDIGRQKDIAIEQGIQQRKSEALNEYNMGKTKYYEKEMYA